MAWSAQESVTAPLIFFSKPIIHTTVIPAESSWDILVVVWLYFIWYSRESGIKSCTLQSWVNYALDLITTSHFLLPTTYLFQLLPFHKIMRNWQERTQKTVWAIPCFTAEYPVCTHPSLPDVFLHCLQRFPTMEILIPPVPVTAWF